MRFYGTAHKHVCGIDLHTRSMYLCVLDEHDQVVLHKDFQTDPAVLLQALATARTDCENPRQAWSVAIATSSSMLSRGQQESALDAVGPYMC